MQATLCELTARTITDDIELYAPDCEEVFICGGGAHNATLVNRLRNCLKGLEVSTTESIGLAPQWVEATAFAWLARQTILGLPGNLPAVTNASGKRILGGIYPA